LSRSEKWEKNGEGCLWVNCRLALLQFSIPGCSAKLVVWVSSPGAEQLCAEQGAETAESDHQGTAEPAKGASHIQRLNRSDAACKEKFQIPSIM